MLEDNLPPPHTATICSIGLAHKTEVTGRRNHAQQKVALGECHLPRLVPEIRAPDNEPTKQSSQNQSSNGAKAARLQSTDQTSQKSYASGAPAFPQPVDLNPWPFSVETYPSTTKSTPSCAFRVQKPRKKQINTKNEPPSKHEPPDLLLTPFWWRNRPNGTYPQNTFPP